MMSHPAAIRAPGKQPELPAFYYHQHFLELLNFLSANYVHVLSPQELDLVNQFRALSLPAQRLYVRLANRKGRIFAIPSLRYPEIGLLAEPLEELRQRGWVCSPGDELYQDVLRFLSKSEIYDCLKMDFGGLNRSLKKQQLIDFALRQCKPAAFMASVNLNRLLVQCRVEWVRFLLFLYFGEIREGLTRFTMRDMGLVHTHAFLDSYEPRFADREQALQAFFFASRLRLHQRGSEQDKQALVDGADDWPETTIDTAAVYRDRLALAIGCDLEKSGRVDEALAVYRRSDSTDCAERLIRLLLSSGRREEAREQLESCLDNPRSEAEWMLADDLYQRKFGRKRTSPATDFLRAAKIIELDETHSGSPERAAIRHFQKHGLQAFRAENTVWRSLFGLLFWDELFLRKSAVLHSPFDALPASLKHGTFYDDFADPIEQKLATLAEPAITRRHLLHISTRHFGESNGVFSWRKSTLEVIFALLTHANHQAVATMLRMMCRSYSQTRDGFPDLLLVDKQGAHFVEIKAEGDQVRRNQLLRLQQMRDAGLRADVVRVRWVVDPLQTYVVVDVETTGGSGEHHRITEIAAVKLRGGIVIERFQTLLNPQRLIPPKITRLTGISDHMVAQSPIFADIADAFSAFIGDAIFVAHNVNFDYGFVSREYARLGKRFRHPKLCTCASMRKLYPGSGSYSLAALCRRYDIPLRQHHRAMCDAEAAAELLLLINEKRAATRPDH